MCLACDSGTYEVPALGSWLLAFGALIFQICDMLGNA